MMQREHRDEATDVLPATFLNEAIRLPILFVAAQPGAAEAHRWQLVSRNHLIDGISA